MCFLLLPIYSCRISFSYVQSEKKGFASLVSSLKSGFKLYSRYHCNDVHKKFGFLKQSNTVYPIHPSLHPSILTCNLCFRVCVMFLRTTTESRGGNRLALCCSPTLTWYDPAPSLCVLVYALLCPHTPNYTFPSPAYTQTLPLINNLC